MYPCPTWIPIECSREWYQEFRSEYKDEEHRRNPVYCFETVPLSTKHHLAAYNQAVKVGRIADFSQYAGHELADLDGCIGADEGKEKRDEQKKKKEKKAKERMVDKKKCKKKFLPLMKHHNIENEECQSKQECQAITDK